MRRPRRTAARHHGRPSRVRPSGEDQQHGGSPERQTTLRQMQPEPSPAVPRPDVPKGHGEALGPIGRMLQHHQDQPASPLCRMLRRRRRKSVCSGHAAHHHRSRHRREKNTLRMNAERTNTRPTLRGSRQSGHRPRIGCECQNRAKGSQSREGPGDRSDLNPEYAPVPEPPRIRGCQARSVVNRSDGQPRVADPVP